MISLVVNFFLVYSCCIHNINRTSAYDSNSELLHSIKNNIINSDPAHQPADTVKNYIQESIKGDYIDLINLTFCLSKLMTVMHNDTSLQKLFLDEISNYPNRWNTKNWNVIAIKGILFFRNSLDDSATVRKDYPEEYRLVRTRIQNVSDIILEEKDYQRIIDEYKRTDGSGFSELSSDYYSLLLSQPCDFLKAVAANKYYEDIYTAWIKEIENYEFTSMGDDMLPASIISSKRVYVLRKLNSCDATPLRNLTIEQIKSARIKVID